MLARLRRRVTGSQLATAAAWSVAAFGVALLLRLGGNLIMTRLLAPEMFGVLSIVLVLQVTLTLFSDFGAKVAVTQSKRGEDPVFLNTAMTIEIIRAVVVWLLCVLTAAALFVAGKASWLVPGTAWASPDLPGAIVVTTFASVINALQSTSLFTAQRRIDTKGPAIIELLSSIVGLLVMIALGLVMHNVWPLVIGAVTSAFVSTALSYVLLPRMHSRLALDRGAAWEILASGRWILLSSTVFVLANNLDRYVLAGFVSAAELGVYAIALNLVVLVETVGMRLIGAIALPALSKTQREAPDQLRAQLMRLRLPLDVSYLMAAGLLFAAGPMIVRILFDERYADAGRIMQILSFSLLFARYQIFGSVYIALGHPRHQATSMVVKLIASAALLIPLVHFFGLIGGTFAVAFHGAAILPYLYWINRRYGFNDLRYEGLVLLAWPVGYAAGLACMWLGGALLGIG